MPIRVRDTFAAVAASRNTTMLALLEEAAQRLEREEAMRQASAQWDALSGDGLSSAASEVPEYNR